MSLNGLRIGGDYKPPKEPNDDAKVALGCSFIVFILAGIGLSIWLYLS